MKDKLPETIKLNEEQMSHYQELINALKQLNKGEIKIYVRK
jgi:hypothetical protein